MKSDTIAAISSGLTQSGIGVIRISGPESIAAADRIFVMKKGMLSDQPTHTVHYGSVVHHGKKMDEALAVLMRSPHSFTAEDVVEIQCHGGPLVMKKILYALLEEGVRLAEPGEFTKRAFLNGRIDLNQAEAVMNVIQAGSDAALTASVQQLGGSLSKKVQKIRSEILLESAYIEAALDDPEHISLEDYPARLLPLLSEWKKTVRDLIDSAEEGKITAEGIRTVILGRPNVGKSSLMNCLLGEDRAIVTDIAGTTRDILEETINMGGFALRLIDTAGIRSTDEPVEKIGVDRAREQAEMADLIIFVVDSSEVLSENDEEIIELLRGKKALVLLNKIDLKQVLSEEELKEKTGAPVLSVSAKEGIGIDQLKAEIEKLFDLGKIREGEGVLVTNLRQKEALLSAGESLKMVQESLDAGLPEDFYTIDLMAAYRSLGRILGEEVEEDLVNEIFSKFCIGK